MKKKFLGIILTLVVMTIIPLAVVAAEPSLTVSGGISSSETGTNVNVTVAVDGKATLTVNDPVGTAEFNKGGDDFVGYKQSGNSITITGNEITSSPVKITVKSGDKTLTCNVTVVAKAITDFVVGGEVTSIKDGEDFTYDLTIDNNTDLYVGDVFTVTGGTVYFNSGESKTVGADEFDPVSTVFVAGQKYVTYNLTTDDPNQPKRSETHDFSETYKVSIIEREYDVAVQRNPNYDGDFVSVYHEGDQFIFDSIRLAVYYENTTTLYTYAYYNEASGFTANSVTMSVDNDEFTVKYNNKAETFSFKDDLGVTTVSKKTVTPALTAGAKSEYVVGEDFLFETLCLNVVDEGSTSKRYTVYYDNGKGFQIDPSSVGYKVIMSTAKEKNTVKVIYDSKVYTIDLEADLDISVFSDHKLVGLKATGTPIKTDYTEGQTVDDWGGVKFYAIYEYLIDGKTQKHEELIPTSKYQYLDVKPFEYSAVYTEINSYAQVAYTEGNYTTPYIKVSGFNVTQRKVESIEVTTPPKKTAYETDEKIDLTGMKITITYNNGDTEVHSYADDYFTCTPAHGEVVAADTRKIAVVYDDGKVTKSTEFVGISVDNTAKIKSAYLTKYPEKTDYEVGERFDPEGMEVTIVFGDKNTPDYVMKDTAFKNINVTFSSEKNTKVNITVKNPYDADDTTVVSVPVNVKAKVIPTDIQVSGYKTKYLVGEYADIEDITKLTVTLSDGTTLDLEDVKELLEIEDTAKKATLKITPATKITAKTKELTVTFTYKGTAVTDTYKIEAIDPVCVLSGSTTVPYESLELALEDANELTTSEAKKVTITLNESVVLTEKYQFNAERTIIIDLNGNDLTMDESQMFVPHKSAYKDVEIIIINSDSSDAKIIYDEDDENMQLVLGKNDELIIDWETEIAGIYEITLTAGENGKITGPQEVAFGNDAKYTITPDEGYEILEVFVDKKSKGKSATVTLENVDEEHEIAASFTKTVVVWENPFTDIYKSAPYYDAIEFVYENELFKGVTTTKFEPNTTMTRAMFVTVLGRLAGIDEYDSRYAGKSSFSDVVSSAATDWYVPYVEWASSIGLLKGYEDGTFRPNREITHTEMYILMERYARNLLGITSGVSGTTIRATDTKDIPTWDGAYEAVQFASKYEFLVLGTSSKITPNGNALRYELAMLLESFCESFGILQEEAAD